MNLCKKNFKESNQKGIRIGTKSTSEIKITIILYVFVKLYYYGNSRSMISIGLVFTPCWPGFTSEFIATTRTVRWIPKNPYLANLTSFLPFLVSRNIRTFANSPMSLADSFTCQCGTDNKEPQLVYKKIIHCN